MGTKLLKVAWWSILLGVGMELALLVVAAGFGTLQGLKPIAADLAQKVSWSFIVCMGLAVGTAAKQLRLPAMGLAGLLAAPLGFHLARVLHKSAVQALAIAGPAAGGPAPMVLALIKAGEYGVLGIIIAWAGKRGWGVVAYVLIGLATGLATTAVVLSLVLQGGATLPAAAIISRAVNEIIFPIGCSLVLYASESVGRAQRSAG